MIALKKFLELNGLVTLKDLIEFYGKEFDSTEFDQMIENREVSVHTEAFGRKNYRYPFYDPLRIPKKGDGVDKLMEFVKSNPGSNASTIRMATKVSQSKFEKWETEMVASEQVTRVKRGRAWLYSASGVELPKLGESTDEDALLSVFARHWFVEEGEYPKSDVASIQALAKSCEISRDSAKKGLQWLEDEGILVDGKLEGFWAMSVDDRRSWMKKNFPSLLPNPVERYIKSSVKASTTKVYTSTMSEDAEKLVRAEGEDGLRFEDLKKELRKGRWTSEDVERLGPALQRLGAQFFKVEGSDELWVSLD